MNRYVCSNCGYSAVETDLPNHGSLCPNCESPSIKFENPPIMDKSNTNNDSLTAGVKPKRLSIEFTGTAGEYFRIWIVNTFLTILTLGIYAAWAKVRNRQYLHKNTVLDGHSFDYTADPKAILKGHLVIGSGIGLYYLAGAYNQIYSLVFIGLFSLVFPFIIYKSIRFFAHNSSYRNIRFRFSGTLGESYKSYLLLPILIPFTLGIIFPYWAFRRKKYFFSNLAYGTTAASFGGRPWPFYKIYIALGSMIFAFFVVAIFAVGVFFPLIKDSLSFDKEMINKLFLLPFLLPIAMYIFIIYLQQELYAWTTNYCWGHSQLGNLRLQSTLKGTRLFWITFSNLIAIIFSLGFLIPWAKLRRMRYVFDNLTIITDYSFNDFTAAVEQDESAYGQATTDFFDIDIGL